jgi:NADH-quinone oxidoreductase subunit E
MSVRRLAAEQPEAFAFTQENLDWAKGQIKKYPEGKQASAVLALLWRAQEQMGGWLPEPALRYVADVLDMAYIRIYEIAAAITCRFAARLPAGCAAPTTSRPPAVSSLESPTT